MQVLFLNEGAPGGGPVGHPRVEDGLRQALGGRDDIRARFRRLGPIQGVARAGMRGVPGLRSRDLDLQQLRWHLIQGARARRAVSRERAAAQLDAIHVVSHAIAFTMGRHLREVPTALAVDATVQQVRDMAVARPLAPRSQDALRPALQLERRALEAAGIVLAWSQWAERDVLRVAPGARTAIHRPGLDLDRFHPVSREPAPRPRVLFVGNRFEAKGGAELLAAMAPLLGRQAELDIVTHEPPPAREGMRVHALGPSDPGLLRLFQECDLFCLPSRGDAFPWAVLEAMACGAPVVATRVGALEELVGDAGVLVPPRDPAALREALTGLLERPGRRAELGALARRRCEAEFELGRQADRLVELLRQLSDGPRA